jgi:DDE family transposase
MALSIAELQPVLHELFHETADDLAAQTGFCRRKRKLTGSVFAQTLVFSLLEKPDATLEDFADFAQLHLDVEASPQAFDDRFGQAAADFLAALFLEAFNQSFSSARPALLPVLRHFAGVYLRDGTLIHLPACLAQFFPGRTGRDGTPSAAVKLVLEMEVATGEFTDVSLLPGLDNEKTAEVAAKPLPPGALLLEDMGFLSGERLHEYIQQGVYVLTRVPSWTAFFEKKPHGKGFVRLDLLRWLRQAKGSCLEREVHIFHQEKLALRLLAARVPEEEAERRRQRVRQEAKQRGRPVSQQKLELCAWNILVTNAPRELLSAYNAGELRRVRWQIELVFKVFKSEGGIQRTRCTDRGRVLSELFAKLLAMVVQQWVLLTAGYVVLRHSARRASRRVRRLAAKLVCGLDSLEGLARAIKILAKTLHRRCRVQRRHEQPSTFDRLAALDAEFREWELDAEFREWEQAA